MYAPLHEIIEAIGLTLAAKLVEARGGTRVYFCLPQNVGPENDIAQIIGVDATRRLAEKWGGDARPTIPRPPHWFYAKRNAEIRAQYETQSVPQLALEWGLTERQIYYILASGDDAAPAAAKQPELF